MNGCTTVITILENTDRVDGIVVSYEKSITNPMKYAVRSESFISNREIGLDIDALKEVLINNTICQLKYEVERHIKEFIKKGEQNNENG